MTGNNPRRARIAALGACAVAAQTLFVRELLGMVTGTELVLGLALASWLIWIGAGGLIGGRLPRPERAFPVLSAALAFLVPVVVILIRAGRSVIVDPPGSIPGAAQAAALLVISMAPFGLLYGAVYNAASEVIRDPEGSPSSGISAAYILEAAGALAGGTVLSIAVLAFLTQMEAAFAVSAAVIAVFLATSRKGRRAAWALAFLAAAAGLALSPRIDRAGMSLVFRGYGIRDIIPSRYAELVAAEIGEEISVFSGGALLATLPDPEGAGERAHVPLLTHPAPSRVLMIGGGAGGGAEAALSHPGVTSVSWIELDATLPATLRKLAGGQPGAGTGNLIAGDGRKALEGTERYELIAIDVPAPVNLRYNRYFTAEAFRAARGALAPGGVLTVRHASSENFLSDANADVLSAVRETLLAAFTHVETVPGGTALFAASDRPIDIGKMTERLAGRGLEGRLLSLDSLPWRISDERRSSLEASLDGAERLVNTDMHPALVPRELLLHAEKAGVKTPRWAAGLLGIPAWIIPLVMVACVVFAGAAVRGGSAARAGVFVTGMCGMTVQVSVMLAWQVSTGVLYHWLVLLTALFMAGIAAGAVIAGRRAVRARSLHLVMAAAALAVPLLLKAPAEFGAGFFALSAAGGILTGAYYRRVVDAFWTGRGGDPPALFYSWDMFGACAGALVAGTILFPLCGLAWTALAAAGMHIASALLIARRF
jgi:spermidine synthase